MRLLFLLLWGTFTVLVQAQTPGNRSALRLEEFMRGEHFVGFLPENPVWSEDGQSVFFSWNPDGDTLRNLYRVRVDGGSPERVSPEIQRELPAAGVYDRAGIRKLYAKDGDLFLMDTRQGKTLPIVQTITGEYNPRFSGDESQVVYQQGDNLFAWDISTGATRQLTQFIRGQKREELRKSSQEQWLETDQLELFEVLRTQKSEKLARGNRQKVLAPKRPAAFYFGERNISNLQISPDLRYVTFRLTSRAKTRTAQMPDYVTSSGFSAMEDTRTKVGAPQDTHETGIYDTERDTVYFVQTKGMEGIFDKPEFLKAYHRDSTSWNSRYDKPREVIVHGPVFSEDGKAVVVVRSQDNKDRWIMLKPVGPAAR